MPTSHMRHLRLQKLFMQNINHSGAKRQRPPGRPTSSPKSRTATLCWTFSCNVRRLSIGHSTPQTRHVGCAGINATQDGRKQMSGGTIVILTTARPLVKQQPWRDCSELEDDRQCE